jgi:PTS system, fru family, IIC component
MYLDVFKNFKKHCMTGISFMIPVIVLGGFCTALGRLFGDVETVGSLGQVFLTAGSAAFTVMMGVLCAGIAYSICGKPGIAPGIIAGYLSNAVKASFLGAVFCGFLIGLLILWMQKSLPQSKAMKSLYPIVIYPVISGIIAVLCVMFLVGPPLAALTQYLVDLFMNMTGVSKFVLGFMMGCMTGFDMGGPVNKICFSIVAAFAASGVYGPAAGKNAAAMAPPLGMAISALILTPKKYTEQERDDAKVAIAMSLCQVTEGALPFAFNDPKRVIPAVTIGSGVAHGLILTWGVTVPVLHGGIFAIPLTSNPLLWIAAYLIGALVTAVIVSVLKPNKPYTAEVKEAELDQEIEIEIG